MNVLKTIVVAGSLLAVTTAQAVGEQIIVETTDNAIVFKVGDNNRLYQSYIGKRLNGKADYDALPLGTEAYLTHGMEDYFEPALHINRADGNPSTLLEYRSHSQAVRDGAVETVITLADPVYGDEVKLHYMAYGAETVFKSWSEITNKEKKTIVWEGHGYEVSVLRVSGEQGCRFAPFGGWAEHPAAARVFVLPEAIHDV